jgi:GntR family carbon starvation induced transcriptional regulator
VSDLGEVESAGDGYAGAVPGSTRSRTRYAFDVIRAEILEGRLLPGSRLHLVLLSERLGISRAAVREALSRLVSEGLAQAFEQRGFRVTPVSVDDLSDLTRVRIEIESLAIKASIERGNAAWEGGIVGAFHELQKVTPLQQKHLEPVIDDWSVVHHRFHYALVAACGSPRLLSIRKGLSEQAERYRKLSVTYHTDDRNLNEEHKQIMEAVIERDAPAAIALLARHFNKTTKILLDASTRPLPSGERNAS